MNLVLWIGDEPNQVALANKLAGQFDIAGIVIEHKVPKRKLTLKKIAEKLFERLFLFEIDKAWFGMQAFYKTKYPQLPMANIITVKNINSDEVYKFSKSINPDLIIVSGTRLIKNKMLSVESKKGILNLHTGLSPYIKGGPNCTNWCIATKQYQYIGNTIMWIDKGIDSGNILTSETIDVFPAKNLLEIHIKVMEHAHRLYLKAIKYLASGKTQSIKQSDIAQGITYYTRDWTLNQKFKLIRNFRKDKNYIPKKIKIRTIYLN